MASSAAAKSHGRLGEKAASIAIDFFGILIALIFEPLLFESLSSAAHENMLKKGNPGPFGGVAVEAGFDGVG